MYLPCWVLGVRSFATTVIRKCIKLATRSVIRKLCNEPEIVCKRVQFSIVVKFNCVTVLKFSIDCMNCMKTLDKRIY